MSIIVNTRNEEERVLKAFLDSLKYTYQSTEMEDETTLNKQFLEHYNQELDTSVMEIENGSFVTHEDVEKLFWDRRKAFE